jgi:hypothetical protein
MLTAGVMLTIRRAMARVSALSRQCAAIPSFIADPCHALSQFFHGQQLAILRFPVGFHTEITERRRSHSPSRVVVLRPKPSFRIEFMRWEYTLE